MKFRIVWIDDSRSWVASVEQDVKDAFIDCQFDPEIHRFEEVGAAREKINELYVDLLIIDFNLPEGVTGDQFILELRRKRCFAHIIFYSQDSSKLNLLTEDKHFIHVISRDNIDETVNIVAEQAYRKYRHPAFMRGLLLSEFIDLENMMEDYISECFWEQSKFFKESIIQKGGESFSFTTKQKFISRVLNLAREKSQDLRKRVDEIGFTGSNFGKMIRDRRNILAHAHPTYDEANQKIVLNSAIGDVKFDSEWFHETREAIHNYKLKIRLLDELNLRALINPISNVSSQ